MTPDQIDWALLNEDWEHPGSYVANANDYIRASLGILSLMSEGAKQTGLLPVYDYQEVMSRMNRVHAQAGAVLTNLKKPPADVVQLVPIENASNE